MFKSKQNLFFLLLLAGLLLGHVVLAQTPPVTSGGTTDNCTNFYNQFNMTTQVTVNGSAKPNGNFVQGLPIFCTPSSLILWVINFGLGFAGIVAIVFLMLGGYFYLTAAGNEEQSEKGKKVLTNSVIGLAVIILSTLIVRIVASTLTTSLGGSSGSSSSQTGSSGNGNPGTTTPPPASCTGSVYDCITSDQINAYNSSLQDYLGTATTITVSPSSQNATIQSVANNINAMTQIKANCANVSPMLYVYKVGNPNAIGSAPYVVNGSSMQATITGLDPFPSAGDSLNVQDCGSVIKPYTVPSN